MVVSPDQSQETKSFWYKVCCKIFGDIFMFYPVHKNLAANLQSHLVALKHIKAQEDAAANIGFVDSVIGNVKVFVCAHWGYTSIQTVW